MNRKCALKKCLDLVTCSQNGVYFGVNVVLFRRKATEKEKREYMLWIVAVGRIIDEG